MNECSLGSFDFECAAQLAKIDLTAAMSKSFGKQFMIVDNGTAFEEMFLGLLQGLCSSGGFVCDALFWRPRQIAQSLKIVEFLWRKPLQLLSSDVFCGDFGQFVGS
jgi:hypothetical protein